jgi:hypothetical protein
MSNAIFVDSNNTVFVARKDNGQILIWRNGSGNLATTITASLSTPSSLFVLGNGDIFVDNGYPNLRVDRYTSNGTRLSSPMSVCSQCSGLFVDVQNNLYCSQMNAHQVVRTSLISPENTRTIVAGTGCPGSASNMLSSPWGIFVTLDLDLYVADCGNDRIQRFQSGQINASTVVGFVLDADGYLFIVDSGNHRIVGSGPGGFRCVAGCSGSGGPASNLLSNPQTMSFDTDGNMFVTDSGNHRIQTFSLATNSCGE